MEPSAAQKIAFIAVAAFPIVAVFLLEMLAKATDVFAGGY